MDLGWKKAMWLTSIGLLLGGLFAGYTGGAGWPTWLVVLLVLFVLVPSAVTLVAEALGDPGKARKQPSPKEQNMSSGHRAATPPGPAGPQSGVGHIRSVDEHQIAVLGRICAGLDSRQISWLRVFDFSGPWLHAHARAVLDLVPLVEEIAVAPFPADIDEAISAFSNRLDSFSAFYAESTSYDPVFAAGEWRYFFALADNGQESVIAEDVDARQARMRELSTGLADAYVNLVGITGTFP